MLKRSWFEYPIAVVWDLMHTHDGFKILEWQSHGISGYSGWDSIHKASLERVVDSISNTVHFSERDYPFVISEANRHKGISASFLGLDIPNMFPKQKTYAATLSGGLAQQVIKDFPNSDYVVLKTPIEAEGKGVFFATPANVVNYEHYPELTKIFGESTIHGVTFPFNCRGHFIVQEGLKPIPLRVWNHEAGALEFCLPSIRLVATIEPLNQSLCWHFHGAYYKLPSQFFANEDDAVQTHIGADDKTPILSKIDGGRGAKSIDPKVFKSLCEEMETGLTPLFERVRQEGPEDFVLRVLQSDNPGDHVSAVEFLMRYSRTREADLSRLKHKTQETLVRAVNANPLLYAFIQRCNPEWANNFEAPKAGGLLSQIPTSSYGSLFGALYQ